MSKNLYHKKFTLNGCSFSSSKEILDYTKTLNTSIYSFFKSWFDDTNFITVQTSGSTGKPKQIFLKKESMVASALATGNFFDLQENTKALLCLSTDYIAGKMMLVRAMVLGWDLDVVLPELNPLKNISKHYHFCAMVPLQLENSLSKIELIDKLIVGGGVVSSGLKAKIKSVKTSIYATYGMTETITHIAVKRLNSLDEISNYYQLLPGIRIYKDTRNCLVIKAPKLSEELIVTNDIVDLVSNNLFEWLGRVDNVINSGGIKLYPEKIEEKLSVHIKERFFVTGVLDASLGQKLILIVEGKPTNINLATCNNLGKYEIPKAIYFVDSFIETLTKKIQRNKTLDLIVFR